VYSASPDPVWTGSSIHPAPLGEPGARGDWYSLAVDDIKERLGAIDLKLQQIKEYL
jgi:hypothetical protein